jgi:hypothetical protein
MLKGLLGAPPRKRDNPEVNVLNRRGPTGYPYNLRLARKTGQQFLSEIFIYTNADHLLSVHEAGTKKKARQEAGLCVIRFWDAD